MSIARERVLPVPPVLGTYPQFAAGLTIVPYVLPGMLGDPKAEEVAARILQRSLVHGQWAGVSSTDLFDESEREFNDAEANGYRIPADARKLKEHLAACRSRSRAAWLTFGIALLFTVKPEKPKPSVVPVPQTLVLTDAEGPGILSTGLNTLFQRKLAASDNVGTDINLYPTPELVLCFMRYCEG